MKALPKHVIIIGAGPSGVFAARQLKKIAEQQQQDLTITILEKESTVGGKCSTFTDPSHPELKTERGAALVAPNYGVVIDAIKEHHLEYEKVLPSDENTIEFIQYLNQFNPFQKISVMIQLTKEIILFMEDYQRYYRAKGYNAPLPLSLKQPFSDYAAQKGMTLLPLFAKPFVPGFGYGDLREIATYSVLEYFGRFTILDILLSTLVLGRPPLLAIKGGFQNLIEKIAQDFDVQTNVVIKGIKREADSVTVHYQQENQAFILKADSLILAISPLHWNNIGLDTTPTEDECIKQLSYYRYPIAVCKIKGLPPVQYFFTEGLQTEGFKHLSLITTRDNRLNPADGRLCTLYVNLPAGPNSYAIDQAALLTELRTIAGVTDVQFIEEKTWEDYMSSLPWDLREALYDEQSNTNTRYCGSFAKGAFEDVVSVANAATDNMNAWCRNDNALTETINCSNVSRAKHFFSSPIQPAVSSVPLIADGINAENWTMKTG